MASHDGNYERVIPSASKKRKSLTLFEDLLCNPNTENVHSGTNPIDQGQNNSFPYGGGTKVSTIELEQKPWLSNGFTAMPDGEVMHGIIKKQLESRLTLSGLDATVETIYSNDFLGELSRAKFHSFGIYSTAIRNKCGADANVQYAWYGTSKNEINAILAYGFGHSLNSGVYGHGVYLSTLRHPLESLLASTMDEEGLRHMLLCRVILGKAEVICPGSKQCNPSSEELDYGVDNLMTPTLYIIWNAYKNIHILPEFVVSVRASSNSGFQRIPQLQVLEIVDWMPMDNIMKCLSNYLPVGAMELVAKLNNDYEKDKISRHAMIQRVRYIVGDNILITMIKSHTRKVNRNIDGENSQVSTNKPKVSISDMSSPKNSMLIDKGKGKATIEATQPAWRTPGIDNLAKQTIFSAMKGPSIGKHYLAEGEEASKCRQM